MSLLCFLYLWQFFFYWSDTKHKIVTDSKRYMSAFSKMFSLSFLQHDTVNTIHPAIIFI